MIGESFYKTERKPQMNNNKTIEEIKRIAKYLGCNEGELISEITNLVQKKVEEGVKGFANWQDEKTEFLLKPTHTEIAEQYISNLKEKE